MLGRKKFVLLLVCRSDHKEIIDEVSENQQSGYTQCKFEFKLFVLVFDLLCIICTNCAMC